MNAKKVIGIGTASKENKKDSISFQFTKTIDEPILKLQNDGKVFWRKNDKMVEAKVDKDLALAFMCVISEITGCDYKQYIEELKKL